MAADKAKLLDLENILVSDHSIQFNTPAHNITTAADAMARVGVAGSVYQSFYDSINAAAQTFITGITALQVQYPIRCENPFHSLPVKPNLRNANEMHRYQFNVRTLTRPAVEAAVVGLLTGIAAYNLSMGWKGAVATVGAMGISGVIGYFRENKKMFEEGIERYQRLRDTYSSISFFQKQTALS